MDVRLQQLVPLLPSDAPYHAEHCLVDGTVWLIGLSWSSRLFLLTATLLPSQLPTSDIQAKHTRTMLTVIHCTLANHALWYVKDLYYSTEAKVFRAGTRRVTQPFRFGVLETWAQNRNRSN